MPRLSSSIPGRTHRANTHSEKIQFLPPDLLHVTAYPVERFWRWEVQQGRGAFISTEREKGAGVCFTRQTRGRTVHRHRPRDDGSEGRHQGHDHAETSQIVPRHNYPRFQPHGSDNNQGHGGIRRNRTSAQHSSLPHAPSCCLLFGTRKGWRAAEGRTG